MISTLPLPGEYAVAPAAGTLVKWYAVVSNYGHIDAVRAVVLSVGPKGRVRIETRYNDGKPERRVNVKLGNLRPAGTS